MPEQTERRERVPRIALSARGPGLAGPGLHKLTPVRTTLAFREHSGNQRAADVLAILEAARRIKRASLQRRTAPGMSKNKSSTATTSIFGPQLPSTQYRAALRQQHSHPSPQNIPANVFTRAAVSGAQGPQSVRIGADSDFYQCPKTLGFGPVCSLRGIPHPGKPCVPRRADLVSCRRDAVHDASGQPRSDFEEL